MHGESKIGISDAWPHPPPIAPTDLDAETQTVKL